MYQTPNKVGTQTRNAADLRGWLTFCMLKSICFVGTNYFFEVSRSTPLVFGIMREFVGVEEGQTIHRPRVALRLNRYDVGGRISHLFEAKTWGGRELNSNGRILVRRILYCTLVGRRL